MSIFLDNSKLILKNPNCLRLLLRHKRSVWVGLDKLIPPLIRQGVLMIKNFFKLKLKKHIIKPAVKPFNQNQHKYIWFGIKVATEKDSPNNFKKFHC